MQYTKQEKISYYRNKIRRLENEIRFASRRIEQLDLELMREHARNEIRAKLEELKKPAKKRA